MKGPAGGFGFDTKAKGRGTDGERPWTGAGTDGERFWTGAGKGTDGLLGSACSGTDRPNRGFDDPPSSASDSGSGTWRTALRIWHRRSSRIFSNWTRHVCRLRIWHRRSSRIFGHSNWTSYLSRLTPGRWSLYPWSSVRIRPNWSAFCRWRRQSFHHNFRKRRRRFFGRCFFNRRIFRRRGRSNSRNVFKRPFFRNWRAFPRNGFDWRCFPRNRFHWHNVLWKIKKTRLCTAPFRLVQNVLVKVVQVTNEFVDPPHIRLRCITTLCWSRSVQFGHRASELEDNLSKCL